jgi:hypothetical protein
MIVQRSLLVTLVTMVLLVVISPPLVRLVRDKFARGNPFFNLALMNFDDN